MQQGVGLAEVVLHRRARQNNFESGSVENVYMDWMYIQIRLWVNANYKDLVASIEKRQNNIVAVSYLQHTTQRIPELDTSLGELREHVFDAVPFVQGHAAPHHQVEGALQRALEHLVARHHHVVALHVQQLQTQDLALRGLIAA